MKKKRSLEMKVETLEKQRIQSGKKVAEFCKEHGIKPSAYYYWRKRSERGKGENFLHVKSNSQEMGEGIRIVYPNGVQVEIWGKMSTQGIKELIGC